jgi:hypothetical protein
MSNAENLVGSIRRRPSHFAISNKLNWGANPYEDYVLNTTYDPNDPADELYMWQEVKNPDLRDVTPEYNNRTGVVDYRFGNEVYDSDTAQVVDSPLPPAVSTFISNANTFEKNRKNGFTNLISSFTNLFK